MKKFILSDLHIGHKAAQYDVMDRTIAYIRQKAETGDEIWGLGDWFHMYESGFNYCLHHPMTKKFLELAGQIPTRLVPGNHDHELEMFRDNPKLDNPINPIKIIKPFYYDNIWYCHGHEYDPSVQYLPAWIFWFWNKVLHKTTPGNYRTEVITEKYLMLAHLVHTRALINLEKKSKEEGQNCKGIILGHTHLPLRQESPDLLFLLNDGDMRHSSTFTVEDDAGFHLMCWDKHETKWQETVIPRP